MDHGSGGLSTIWIVEEPVLSDDPWAGGFETESLWPTEKAARGRVRAIRESYCSPLTRERTRVVEAAQKMCDLVHGFGFGGFCRGPEKDARRKQLHAEIRVRLGVSERSMQEANYARLNDPRVRELPVGEVPDLTPITRRRPREDNADNASALENLLATVPNVDLSAWASGWMASAHRRAREVFPCEEVEFSVEFRTDPEFHWEVVLWEGGRQGVRHTVGVCAGFSGVSFVRSAEGALWTEFGESVPFEERVRQCAQTIAQKKREDWGAHWRHGKLWSALQSALKELGPAVDAEEIQEDHLGTAVLRSPHPWEEGDQVGWPDTRAEEKFNSKLLLGVRAVWAFMKAHAFASVPEILRYARDHGPK